MHTNAVDLHMRYRNLVWRTSWLKSLCRCCILICFGVSVILLISLGLPTTKNACGGNVGTAFVSSECGLVVDAVACSGGGGVQYTDADGVNAGFVIN